MTNSSNDSSTSRLSDKLKRTLYIGYASFALACAGDAFAAGEIQLNQYVEAVKPAAPIIQLNQYTQPIQKSQNLRAQSLQAQNLRDQGLHGFKNLTSDPVSHAQQENSDKVYWKSNEFRIPFQWLANSNTKAISGVELYGSNNKGLSWQKISSAKPSVQAFKYRSQGDGEYWFSLRTIDAQGHAWPEGPYQPEMKVVVDTKLPQIKLLSGQLSNTGQLIIRYDIHDWNLNHQSLNLEYQIVSDQNLAQARWTKAKIEEHRLYENGMYVAAGLLRLQLPAGTAQVKLQATVEDYAKNRAIKGAVVQENKIGPTHTANVTPENRTPTAKGPYQQPQVRSNYISAGRGQSVLKNASPLQNQQPGIAPLQPTDASLAARQRAAQTRNLQPQHTKTQIPDYTGRFQTAAQRASNQRASNQQRPNPLQNQYRQTNTSQSASRIPAPSYPRSANRNTTNRPANQTVKQPTLKPTAFGFTKPPAKPNINSLGQLRAKTQTAQAATNQKLTHGLNQNNNRQPQGLAGPVALNGSSSLKSSGSNPASSNQASLTLKNNPTAPFKQQHSNQTSNHLVNTPQSINRLSNNRPQGLTPITPLAPISRRDDGVYMPAKSRVPARNASLQQLRDPEEANRPTQSVLPGWGAVAATGWNNQYRMYLPTGETPVMVKSVSFDLEYDIESVGNYGIRRVELWGTRDGGKNWKRYSIDTDNVSPLQVLVEEEGLYGFKILVESAAGSRIRSPKSGDKPEMWVGVDEKSPQAALLNIRQGFGNKSDHLEITWEARDENLANHPITLSYATYPEGPWKPIASALRNTGKYGWTIERHLPSVFYIQLAARDSAGNIGTYTTDQPVVINRPQPTGRLRGARPSRPTRPTDNIARPLVESGPAPY